MTFARALGVAGMVAVVTACSRSEEVRATVVPGSSARAIAFAVHRTPPGQAVRGFRIAQSRLAGRYAGLQGAILWQVVPTQGSAAMLPDTVRYGVAPQGFTAGPAAALGPGEYEIEIIVGGHSSISYFTIGTDGKVS